MISNAGNYIGHNEDGESGFTAYPFTPCPLMSGDFYTMNNSFYAVLSDIYQNLGFLGGIIKLHTLLGDVWHNKTQSQ